MLRVAGEPCGRVKAKPKLADYTIYRAGDGQCRSDGNPLCKVELLDFFNKSEIHRVANGVGFVAGVLIICRRLVICNRLFKMRAIMLMYDALLWCV